MRRRTLLISLPSFGLGGCALVTAPGDGLTALPPDPGGPYILGPGDQLSIRVYDQPQLSGDYIVDDSGMIDMPLIGLCAVSGKTSDDLTRDIKSALQAQKLILAPSVAVEVTHYRPFYILGEVTTPGQYPYRPGMTVLTAVSIAGGFTYRGVQDYVAVTRNTGGAAVQYRAPNFALVRPGDVITVFERRF